MICNLCPRECDAERTDFKGNGFCKSPLLPVLAKADLHFWEEPCISGTAGSGTVFFSGCSLKCAYCQNKKISADNFGKVITLKRLREIYFELIKKGAHNINLVNPTHFAHSVAESLYEPLPVPVVYNSSGYEKTETLKMLKGKIQIYLPDLKYSCDTLAKKYSSADNYFETAKRAIEEMYSQVGKPVFDSNGILQSGVIIRHMVLPNNIENTLGVIDYVADTFKNGEVLFSLMGQYTPVFGVGEKYPELARKLKPLEYKICEKHLYKKGIEDGFIQELGSADETFIPDFNLSGI